MTLPHIDVAIVVPKFDELSGVLQAFGVKKMPAPSGNIEIDRRPSVYQVTLKTSIPNENISNDISIGIVWLGERQTNTYSGALTDSIIDLLNPRQIYLIGTALGNPTRSPIGSVIFASRVIDVSEKRPGEDRGGWVASDIEVDTNLLTFAKTFLGNRYNDVSQRRRFFERLQSVSENGKTSTTRDLMTKVTPIIDCEYVVSGNEYIMDDATRQELWKQFSHCNAYDMEAAGFCLAAEFKGVPCLVIRAVSDHGVPETKSDRTLVTKGAAEILREFLESGENRMQSVHSSRPNTSAIETPLSGKQFHGFMGYLDDSGNLVIYSESAEFKSERTHHVGVIRSVIIDGNANARHLDYRVEIYLSNNEFMAGTWSSDIKYFGVIAGMRDGLSIRGTWLGTHGEGIRTGIFVWYSVEGESAESYNERLKSFKSEMERRAENEGRSLNVDI